MYAGALTWQSVPSSVEETEPTGDDAPHLWHSAIPGWLATVSSGHNEHSASELAPGLERLPAGHSAQAAAAFVAEKLPLPHDTHCPPSAASVK